MSTEDFSNTVVAITSDPSIQTAFNDGFYFGLAVLVGAMGLWMFRHGINDVNEEP